MTRLIGWLWWLLLPVRKHLAIANYRQAFPDRDPGELRRTVGEMVMAYVHLLLGRRAEVEGVELLSGGGIIVAGHGTNWDIALISVGERVPLTIFVKPPSNRLAAWAIERWRRAAGVELLPPHGSMAAAYDALARGRCVVFVQDQRHNKGIAVPFFGRPALTSPAMAAMIWRSRRPVFGTWQWCDRGRYRVRVERLHWPVPENRDEAIVELTARSQRFYEDRIRTAPHGWLWLHDRWKNAPPRCEDPLGAGPPGGDPPPDDGPSGAGVSAPPQD